MNGSVEVGGPERFRMNDLVARVLQANGDGREVIADSQARYFGAVLNDQSLVTAPGARAGSRRFDEWLKESTVAAPRGKVA